MRVAIAGNSNSGKTTLFNALTKSSERTGNWHGVTVDVTSKTADFFGNKVEVFDVPGIISLTGYSLEEKVACDFLKEKNFDVIVCVIETATFLHSAKLLKELTKFNKPIVVFFNFYKEFVRLGGKMDFKAFERAYGARTVVGEAISGRDVEVLKKEILKADRLVYNRDFETDGIFAETKTQLGALDKIFLNNKLLFPISAVIIAVVFYLAFGRYGIGVFAGNLIGWLVDLAVSGVDYLLTKWGVGDFLCGLVSRGIIGGMGSVLVFIPQIAVLNLCLIILEQTGIIGRISFLSDNALSKLGLSGRAVFSLIMGFGCTAVASELAGGMESVTMKKRLSLALPFVTCSARMPAIMFIASKCFAKYAFVALIAVYFLSVVLSLAFLHVQKKLDGGETRPLVLEIPPLRGINVQNTLKPLIKTLKEFIIKVISVITLVSVGVYFLKSFSVGMKYLPGGCVDESILGRLGEGLKFLFAPIGLDDWRISTSLLSGLFAKEAILSTLYLTGADGIALTAPEGSALIAFIAFYTPCTVALECMRRKVGFFATAVSALFQFAFALILAYAVYCLWSFTAVKLIGIAVVTVVTVIKLIGLLKRNEKIYCKNGRKTV